ncbi:hypothetical protein BC936DRAFT_149426, partial [Jimgerdemannia flammicorona]
MSMYIFGHHKTSTNTVPYILVPVPYLYHRFEYPHHTSKCRYTHRIPCMQCGFMMTEDDRVDSVSHGDEIANDSIILRGHTNIRNSESQRIYRPRHSTLMHSVEQIPPHCMG